MFRLLAEAAWCPTLLLPSSGLAWTAKDDRRAVAALTHGGETVTVEFRFNEAGEIAGVYAADRPRQYGTVYVPTAWEGHFSGYDTIDGVRLPKGGEVGWWVDGRWVPVWQGTINRAALEFVR